MRTADFDYVLPAELIAQEPLEDRTASRLLVLRRDSGDIENRGFGDVARYLRAGDLLVLNDSRVTAFRLRGWKPTGASVEALFVERKSGSVFRALMKPGRRLRAGDVVCFGEGFGGRIMERLDDGSRLIELQSADVDDAVRRYAETPLPPYIKRPLRAGDRYQTVYAASHNGEGSSAAPTAGLHFSERLLEDVRRKGVNIARVTLDIGASTFRPVRSETLEEHVLAKEFLEVTPEAAEAVNRCRGRVFAVGTTSTRALEAASVAPGVVRPFRGWTDLFIRPGHEFRIVQALITNFHMPRSTLFMLVAAFAGREKLLAAYAAAVREHYRFLSLGDAMLVL